MGWEGGTAPLLSASVQIHHPTPSHSATGHSEMQLEGKLTLQSTGTQGRAEPCPQAGKVAGSSEEPQLPGVAGVYLGWLPNTPQTGLLLLLLNGSPRAANPKELQAGSGS